MVLIAGTVVRGHGVHAMVVCTQCTCVVHAVHMCCARQCTLIMVIEWSLVGVLVY